MRTGIILALSVSIFGAALAWAQPLPKDGQKEEPKSAKEAKDTPAAERTRAKLLKARVSGSFTEVRLGDVLKEFAAQVDMQTETPVMWAYAAGFPYSRKVTYACKAKPLEEALDELLPKLGDLGYVVVSKDGDKYDGWVRLTTTGERGYEPGTGPKVSEEDEKAAAERLTTAKQFIADGKSEQAKTLLLLVTKKYPHATAAREARQLLAKIEK